MDQYMPPRKWKRKDDLRAEASDGSQAWLDVRGLVGLCQPNGFYVSLGAEFADDGGEPHDGKYGPPPKKRQIKVFAERSLKWSKGGYQTEEKLSEETRSAVLDSIVVAMKALSYSIEYSSV